jgi:DNA-binding MarR family transcriptional regulator/GNAT superfamily N-acetyltransferase
MGTVEASADAGAGFERVDAVRRFNRFYTRQIGLLQEGLYTSLLSLTQVRVVYEIANHDGPTATDVGQELGLDAGYLSRLLRDFEKRGLIERTSSEADGRQSHLWLTAEGRALFVKMRERAREEVGEMLRPLSEGDQRRLLEAMGTIERLLGGAPNVAAATPYILRPPHAGDMGWVVARNGALYAQEYHWDDTYEGLAAKIVGDFVQQFDPKRERCWIAEKDGENVGSVFVVKGAEEGVAKLRLLLVEPSARGLGIGKRLVEECLRFARRVGYKRMTLWTQSILLPARRIYAQAGFRLVKEEPHHSFGHDLVGETWEMDL